MGLFVDLLNSVGMIYVCLVVRVIAFVGDVVYC